MCAVVAVALSVPRHAPKLAAAEEQTALVTVGFSFSLPCIVMLWREELYVCTYFNI